MGTFFLVTQVMACSSGGFELHPCRGADGGTSLWRKQAYGCNAGNGFVTEAIAVLLYYYVSREIRLPSGHSAAQSGPAFSS